MSNQPIDALDDPEYRKQVQGLKDVTSALKGEPTSLVIFSTDAESVLNRKMLSYTKTNENRLGWHIEFTEPILEANFKEACKIAIELAKVECHLDGAIAINFVAQGVPVQVVETSNIETQFALWKRWVEGDAKTEPSLPTAFTNLISQTLTPDSHWCRSCR